MRNGDLSPEQMRRCRFNPAYRRSSCTRVEPKRKLRHDLCVWYVTFSMRFWKMF